MSRDDPAASSNKKRGLAASFWDWNNLGPELGLAGLVLAVGIFYLAQRRQK